MGELINIQLDKRRRHSKKTILQSALQRFSGFSEKIFVNFKEVENSYSKLESCGFDTLVVLRPLSEGSMKSEGVLDP